MKALAEIYTIHTSAQISDLKISIKILSSFCKNCDLGWVLENPRKFLEISFSQIFVKTFQKKMTKIAKVCQFIFKGRIKFLFSFILQYQRRTCARPESELRPLKGRSWRLERADPIETFADYA